MWFSKLLLRIAGWKVDITLPDYPKSIICVAPHTSNWDFILGKLAYASVGRKAGFLMKEAWFFFPLGCFFKAIGGIPVPKRKGSSLVDTPEGTRSRTTEWRHGILHISRQAHVPIALGIIDYPTRQIIIRDSFTPTGDVEADMRAIKDYYKPYTGRYPEKFTTD